MDYVSTTRVESTALAAKSQSFSANSRNNFSGNGATVKGKEKQVYTHCGKMGHKANKCYRLHGVPPGFMESLLVSSSRTKIQWPIKFLQAKSNLKIRYIHQCLFILTSHQISINNFCPWLNLPIPQWVSSRIWAIYGKCGILFIYYGRYTFIFSYLNAKRLFLLCFLCKSS